jgi:hypothetical protein
MKTHFFTFLIVLLGLQVHVQAQSYNHAIGAKLGYGLVGSYKKFLNDNKAIELFGGIRWGGDLIGGGFFQIHKDISDLDNLQWYYGLGAAYSLRTYLLSNNYSELTGHLNLGLEYTFEDFPIVLSVDYAPGFVIFDTYNFVDTYRRFRGLGSVTARYIIGGDFKL